MEKQAFDFKFQIITGIVKGTVAAVERLTKVGLTSF